MARRPVPTKLKILRGNPGKRALNKREPIPSGDAEPPAHLNEEARAEWRRVAPELERMGLLTKIDGTAFAGYCQTYAIWAEASRNVEKHGMIFKAPSGYPQVNPFLSIARTALAEATKFMTEFGMTPAARVRIKVEPKKEDDPLESFMNRESKTKK